MGRTDAFLPGPQLKRQRCPSVLLQRIVASVPTWPSVVFVIPTPSRAGALATQYQPRCKSPKRQPPGSSRRSRAQQDTDLYVRQRPWTLPEISAAPGDRPEPAAHRRRRLAPIDWRSCVSSIAGASGSTIADPPRHPTVTAAPSLLSWLHLATTSSARFRAASPYLFVRKIPYVISSTLRPPD